MPERWLEMIKKIGSLVLVMIFAVLSIFSVNAVSYNESENTITLDVSPNSDIYYELQNALNTARERGTDLSPCRVIIPKGNYSLSWTVKIYSNTILSAYGANIKKCYTGGCMLRSGSEGDGLSGYDGYRNITLEGGVWDGNCFDSRYNGRSFSNLRFGHMRNLVLKDISVLNNKDAHHIELGGVKNVQIYGCYLSGYTGGTQEGQEAIQLDVCTKSAFDGYDNFDSSPCEDVYIHDNKFDNVYRGVGSHNAVAGKYYKNINIYDNTFSNTPSFAVYGYNWINSKIYSNTMTDVGGGIDVRSVAAKFSDVSTSGNLSLQISNNVIKISKKSNLSTVVGIRVWTDASAGGAVSTSIPLEKRTVQSVSVTGNKISGRTRFGICLSDAYKCTVSQNTVDGTENDNTITSSRALFLSRSSNNTVSGNTFKNIRNSDSGGIQIEKSSNNNTVSSNTVSNVEKAGISINGAQNNTVSGGKIENCNNQGIAVSNGAKGNVIKGVSVSNTGGNSVTINSSDNCTISGVKVASGKANGINVSASKGASVYSNTVEGCSSIGISINSASSASYLNDNRVISCGAGSAISVSSDSSAPVNSLTRVTLNATNVKSGSISGKTKANTYVEVCNGSSMLGKAKSNSYGEFTVKFTAPGNTASLLALIKDSKNNSSCGRFTFGNPVVTVATPKISGFQNTQDGIKISWNKVSGAYKYRVYYKGSNGWTRLAETSGTSVVDTDVRSGKTYTYTIRCVDSYGRFASDYNGTGWKHMWIATPKVSRIENTASGIRLSWNSVPGAYGYRVYYKNANGNWARFKNDVYGTTKLDTGVKIGRTETYTIRCVDKNGNLLSDYNKSGFSIKYQPVAPTLSLKNTANGIEISWNKIAGVDRYRVYYKNSSGNWVRFKNDIYGTSMLDKGVKVGRAETYTIRCVDSSGNLASGYNSAGWTITYRK